MPPQSPSKTWNPRTSPGRDRSMLPTAIGRRPGVLGSRLNAAVSGGAPSEYEEWRKQQLGNAATRPHRITYRKLTR